MPSAARAVDRRTVLWATVTPLASIFGSGFLILVPVLERSIGSLAIVGVIGACTIAWFLGSAIRHIVGTVEPLAAAGRLDPATARLERISDVLIVIAYVISVALYLRIMAQYIVNFASPGSVDAERALASAAVVAITVVGVIRGFAGLDALERVALVAVLVLTTVLGGAFFFADAGDLLGQGLQLPPLPDTGLGTALLMVGGVLIAVQGFETVRYLGEEYDAPTRIWASRVAQLVATSIYVGFVAVSTPLMGIGTPAGIDTDLLDITQRVVPVLAPVLVLCAVLSQFSAATADTAAVGGNLHSLASRAMRGSRAYALNGIAAVALIWAVPTLTIITVASRAFGAYYCAQCVIAMRTCDGTARKLGYGALAVLMAAVTLLALPAS
ncbi:MAG: hypothetical protein ABI726_07995 [bacterium]